MTIEEFYDLWKRGFSIEITEALNSDWVGTVIDIPPMSYEPYEGISRDDRAAPGISVGELADALDVPVFRSWTKAKVIDPKNE